MPVALAVVLVALLGRGGEVVHPFAYSAGQRAAFEARGAAGESYLLYADSPGGVLATAGRVANLHGPIEAAAATAGVDPSLVEAIVFLESGGRSDAMAEGDPAGAAGVTQILPQTGRDLLGMRIDVSASRRLTTQIAAARNLHQSSLIVRLEGQRRRIDQRFDPRAALAATGRYLAFSTAPVAIVGRARTREAQSSFSARSEAGVCRRAEGGLLASAPPCERVLRCRTERAPLREDTLTGNVVELQADALGVTKRHRVVARSPWSLLRSSHDLGTELLKERIQLVDVLARAGAEAEVVNAWCEFLVRML
jgi:hypothetical protein